MFRNGDGILRLLPEDLFNLFKKKIEETYMMNLSSLTI